MRTIDLGLPSSQQHKLKRGPNSLRHLAPRLSKIASHAFLPYLTSYTPNTTETELMTRLSPPTDRVIDILEFLAANPTNAYSLADIVRHLDITKATCHVILGALANSGYVVRNDQAKTYGLGPSLIALGLSAQMSFPTLAVARREIANISEDLNEEISAAAMFGNSIVVLERLGPGAHRAPVVGSRVPLTPPIGAGFIAWMGEDAFTSWVDRAGRDLSDAEVQRLHSALAEIRQFGYGVERLSPAWLKLRTFLEDVPPELPENVRRMVHGLSSALGPEHYLDAELNAADAVPVGVIHSTVFNHHRHPELSIAANVYRDSVPVADVRRIASRLAEGATRITEQIGGAVPTEPHNAPPSPGVLRRPVESP